MPSLYVLSLPTWPALPATPPHTQLLKGKAFILKSLVYDSVHRADLFELPCAPSALEAYLARPDITISTQQPWILQEFLKVRTGPACL